ncbi:NTP transferase domain-containing protein [Shewanella sp. VB17]|uniref:cytidylyltransferase domain-containing protein n=1 Tax=Shewanella sp. VB17 TaxID=2739432 RepID=UPI00156422D8|nr:NTP transferase domain-containing protein [Shewanella sp. VB17]NRD74822.1 NTP transferase domain-containing protein [Shewanella sp. VB17]
MKSIAIIGARLNSSRLPKKHLLPLAGHPLIHRLITRLQRCSLLDEIIVATTADNFNLPLVEAVESLVPVAKYNGDVNDLMGRLDSVVTQYDPDFIVYICGDCPLVEPLFIDHALALLATSPEKNSIKLKDTIVSIHEGIGFYSREGWNKLMFVSQCSMSREHVGYGDKLTPVLERLEIDDCDDFTSIKHRISVDTLADYQFMQQIYSNWYLSNHVNSIVDLKWVQNQLISQSHLSKINQHVVQKDPSKIYKKISLYCHISAKIGIGHLKRCQLISEFLIENLGIGIELHIIGEQHQILIKSTNNTWYPTLDTMINQMKIDENPLWLLDFHPEHVDIEKLKLAIQKVKKHYHTRIIALDKLIAIIDHVDELFIPSFYSHSQNIKISYGWDHLLLSKPKEHTNLEQLLVITGGSDALGYGEHLPTLIESVTGSNIQLHWVQGPLAKPPKLRSKGRWHIHKNPSNLPELIAQSKIILSCYGLSLFESIASGNLVLLLPVEHLCGKEELLKLKSANCCITTDSQDMKHKIQDAIDNPEQFKYMQKNAKKILKPGTGLEHLSQHVTLQLSIFDSEI